MPTFRPQRLVNDARQINVECLQHRDLTPAAAFIQTLQAKPWHEIVKYVHLLHLAITQMESAEEWAYWLNKVKFTPTLAPTATASPAAPSGVAFRDGEKAVIKWTADGALVGNLTTRQNVTALVADKLGLPMRGGSLVADRMKLVELLATKFPIDGDIRQEQS